MDIVARLVSLEDQCMFVIGHLGLPINQTKDGDDLRDAVKDCVEAIREYRRKLKDKERRQSQRKKRDTND